MEELHFSNSNEKTYAQARLMLQRALLLLHKENNILISSSTVEKLYHAKFSLKKIYNKNII